MEEGMVEGVHIHIRLFAMQLQLMYLMQRNDAYNRSANRIGNKCL